jgi:hypothetical protein
MTVATTSNRKTYAGDNVSTSFATSPVVFFDTSDLSIQVVNNTTGVSTLLVENTDYTVTGGDGTTGTVNLAGGSAPHGALLSGTTLVILRVLPITQTTDFVNGDNSDAEVAETALDRLTMVAQQLQETLDRAITLPSGDVSGSTNEFVSAASRAGLLLGFDASGLLTYYVPQVLPSSTITATVKVATPLVGTTTAADFFIETNGLNRWQIENTAGQMYPVGDNAQDIGKPTQRLRQVFTPIIDSGTTSPLSLSTNNGSQQMRLLNVTGAATFIDVFGGSTGSPANIGASGETNTNLNVFSTGTGTISLLTGGGVQLQVLHTASATRNITITGSNGGNPTLGVTGGSLAITPAVVMASTLVIQGGTLQVGTNPSATGTLNVPYGVGSIATRNNANSADQSLIDSRTVNGAVNITGLGLGGGGILAQAQIRPGVPTTSDIATGQWALWRDTSGATTKLYYNNAGSLQSVALA